MAWKKIKEIVTKKERVNSVGYLQKVLVAADVFIKIKDELKNPQKDLEEFNKDEDVATAFVNYKIIKDILK